MFEWSDRILREAPTEKGLQRRQLALLATLNSLECLPPEQQWIHDIPPHQPSAQVHRRISLSPTHRLTRSGRQCVEQTCARR